MSDTDYEVPEELEEKLREAARDAFNKYPGNKWLLEDIMEDWEEIVDDELDLQRSQSDIRLE